MKNENTRAHDQYLLDCCLSAETTLFTWTFFSVAFAIFSAVLMLPEMKLESSEWAFVVTFIIFSACAALLLILSIVNVLVERRKERLQKRLSEPG